MKLKFATNAKISQDEIGPGSIVKDSEGLYYVVLEDGTVLALYSSAEYRVTGPGRLGTLLAEEDTYDYVRVEFS